MNWLGWFLPVQPEQTLMRQTPTWTVEQNCFSARQGPCSLGSWSQHCDQQSPVSYTCNSHMSVPPPGPSHASSSPSPSISWPSPNSGLFYSQPAAHLRTWKSFCPPDLNPSVSTNTFDTWQQNSKVTEGKLIYGHFASILLAITIIIQHLITAPTAQLYPLPLNTEWRLRTDSLTSSSLTLVVLDQVPQTL